MTKKKSRSNRTAFVFVFALVGIMGAILSVLYLVDQDTDAQVVRNVALNLHIEDTTCDNVKLALEQNERSIRDKIVRDELNRVLEEGNCNISTMESPFVMPERTGTHFKRFLQDGITLSDKTMVSSP